MTPTGERRSFEREGLAGEDDSGDAAKGRVQRRTALFSSGAVGSLQSGTPIPLAGKEGTRRVEIWQALDTTNLHELASAASTVIGEVGKGSTFRVIGRSVDGKWLKIETRDGLTGYYWAARAREKR